MSKQTFTYDSNKHFLCHCSSCGWIGTSDNLAGGGQIADTGDFDDVYCPICLKIDPDEHDLSVDYKGMQTIEVDVIPMEQLEAIKQKREKEEMEYIDRLIEEERRKDGEKDDLT